MRSCFEVIPLAVDVTAIALTEWVKKYDCDFVMTSGREYKETGEVRLCFPRTSFQTSLLSCIQTPKDEPVRDEKAHHTT